MERRSKCEYRRSTSNANQNRIPVRSRRHEIGSAHRWAVRRVGKSARANFFSSMYNKRVSHPARSSLADGEKKVRTKCFTLISISI